MRKLLATLAAAATLWVPAVAAAETKKAPDFTVPNALTGKPLRLSDYKGKVVILDFWATWCHPCRKEIPDFISLQKQYGPKGLVVVGLALDQEGADVVVPFAKQAGINYPLGIGNSDVTAAYGGVRGIPTTFVIDRQGHIVKKFVGAEERATFEAEIKPLLK